MRKKLSYFILILFIVLSFYYTEKIVRFVQKNTELYKVIEDKSINYNKSGEDAKVVNDYIIPGISSMEVNVLESYYKMKELNVFNDSLLVYNSIIPDISVMDNKDKIINRGNYNKKSVSIITSNEKVLNYCYLNNVYITTFSDYINNYNDKYEYLNKETEENNFNKVESLLDKYKRNKDICYLNNNYELCKKNNKFIIDSTVILNKSNLLEVKTVLESGYIIYVENNVSIEEFIILVNYIKNNNLSIVHVSKLISEER